MSEYKENTVGWQLSQLKEPLKSRALELVKEDETDEFLASSLTEAIDAIIDAHPWMDDSTFWRGVNDFFYGESQLDSEDENGWDMAKECTPDNWLKPKDGGEDKAIVDSPAPEIPVTGAMIEDFSKRVKWPITREIEAPERAVVGYEEPKPIDTIEKKHELRIKNLEAYNKYQAERNQQIMDLNPHVDFCDSEGNLVRPSRMTALEARVKELEDQLFKLLGSKNG
mgnify:CR=1 FL=1